MSMKNKMSNRNTSNKSRFYIKWSHILQISEDPTKQKMYNSSFSPNFLLDFGFTQSFCSSLKGD